MKKKNGKLVKDVSTKAHPCRVSEEQLWSWIDRDAQELSGHLEACPRCRALTDKIRRGISAAAQSLDDGAAFPPPKKLGPYEITRVLGRGGQGVVYEAQQQSPKRLVALKVIHGGHWVDAHDLKLFGREVDTLARLKHPSIAAIFEAGVTAEGQHFFAMERVEGVPLNAYVRRRRLSPPAKLKLFREICLAIHHAHQRGVIHRDLKPTNILVDSSGRPKILDFGLARIIDKDCGVSQTVLDAGKIQGTAPYMSPEQASGRAEEMDVRSDVYSLGVMLYELMTDHLPFKTDSHPPLELIRMICDELPPRPASLNAALRGDLEAIILKSMAKKPSERYQSAIELADDLQRFLTSQPILARPPSATYQLRKLIGRHKLPFAFTVSLFTLTVGATVWVSILYSQSAREARRAQAINTYLRNMLAAFNPYNPRGLKKTLDEVLEEASDRVKTDLNIQPDTEASVHQMLGEIYYNLGRYGKAQTHFLSAMRLHAKWLDERHPDLLACQQDVTKAAYAVGGLALAYSQCRDLLQLQEEWLEGGLFDENVLEGFRGEVAETMSLLGNILVDLGRFEEAREQFEHALDLRRKQGETDSEAVAELEHDLGVALTMPGEFERARTFLEDALRRRVKHFGASHPYVARTLEALGRWALKQDRFDEAEAYLTQALALQRQGLPGGHPDIARSLVALGEVWRKTDRLSEAEEALKEALAIRETTLSDRHWLTAEVLVNLARCRMARNEFPSARDLLETADVILNGALRSDHWRIQEVSDLLEACDRLLERSASTE